MNAALQRELFFILVPQNGPEWRNIVSCSHSAPHSITNNAEIQQSKQVQNAVGEKLQ